MSKRDDIIARNKMAEFYAVMSGRPALHVKPVPDLKPRKERAPSMEPTERASQRALIEWWFKAHHAYGLPKFALFAVPNGQILRGDEKARAIQMTSMKLEGFRNGVPDLMLAVPKGHYSGLFIELKTRTGIVSAEQKAFIEYLNLACYKAEVCRSTELAIEAITTYLRGN